MPTCSATDESCSSELTSLPLAEEMDTPTCSVAGEGTQLQEVPTHKRNANARSSCNEASQCKYLSKVKSKKAKEHKCLIQHDSHL